MFYDEVKKAACKCEICEHEIPPSEPKMVVERKTIHKSCFKCAFCECELQMGKCALEPYFFHSYGPLWFCREHSKLPPGQKEAQLTKRGLQPRKKGGGAKKT